MLKPLAHGLLLLIAFAAGANAQSDFSSHQDAAVRAKEEPQAHEQWLRLEPSEKFIIGNQGYRNSDTSLYVGLPEGFNITGDFNWYESDTSSSTPSYSIGAGKDWDFLSVSALYSQTLLANDFESNSIDLRAAIHTDSRDLRTTAGADVSIVHNTQFARFPNTTAELQITQRVPTFSLKQQLYNLRLTVDLTQYTYNKDPGLVAAILTKLSNYFVQVNGMSGLVSGFPDWSDKFGAYYDLDMIPLTLWGTYQNIHNLDTSFGTGQSTDSFTFGADYDVIKQLTVTFQYNHLRETGQVPLDLYGLNLAARF